MLPLLPPILLSLGDSIALGWGTPPGTSYALRVAHVLGLTLDSRAVASYRLADMRGELQLIPGRAAVAMALVGFNDMRAATPLTEFRADLDALITLLKARADQVSIGNCLRMLPYAYALGAPTWSHGSDTAVAQYNATIAAAVTAAGVTLVDAAALYDPANHSDHIHPNETGHRQLTAAFLAQMLP